MPSTVALLIGGEARTGRSTQVTPSMKLDLDEAFGPVVAVNRARDEAHALALADDTESGLFPI